MRVEGQWDFEERLMSRGGEGEKEVGAGRGEARLGSRAYWLMRSRRWRMQKRKIKEEETS